MKLRTLISLVHRPGLNAPCLPVAVLCSGSMIKVDITSSVRVSLCRNPGSKRLRLVGAAPLRTGFAQQECQQDGDGDAEQHRHKGRLIVAELAVPAAADMHQPLCEDRAEQCGKGEVDEVLDA